MLLDLREKRRKITNVYTSRFVLKRGKSHYSGAICFSFSYNHRSFQGTGNDGYLEIHNYAV